MKNLFYFVIIIVLYSSCATLVIQNDYFDATQDGKSSNVDIVIRQGFHQDNYPFFFVFFVAFVSVGNYEYEIYFITDSGDCERTVQEIVINSLTLELPNNSIALLDKKFVINYDIVEKYKEMEKRGYYRWYKDTEKGVIKKILTTNGTLAFNNIKIPSNIKTFKTMMSISLIYNTGEIETNTFETVFEKKKSVEWGGFGY
ncbi:hypothetical protein FACS189462_0540 [Spirochaetia bacterium]|nr:hypothetical protein FACS189462_0540 [Spirochaetia bacterium]